MGRTRSQLYYRSRSGRYCYQNGSNGYDWEDYVGIFLGHEGYSIQVTGSSDGIDQFFRLV